MPALFTASDSSAMVEEEPTVALYIRHWRPCYSPFSAANSSTTRKRSSHVLGADTRTIFIVYAARRSEATRWCVAADFPAHDWCNFFLSSEFTSIPSLFYCHIVFCLLLSLVLYGSTICQRFLSCPSMPELNWQNCCPPSEFFTPSSEVIVFSYD